MIEQVVKPLVYMNLIRFGRPIDKKGTLYIVKGDGELRDRILSSVVNYLKHIGLMVKEWRDEIVKRADEIPGIVGRMFEDIYGVVGEKTPEEVLKKMPEKFSSDSKVQNILRDYSWQTGNLGYRAYNDFLLGRGEFLYPPEKDKLKFMRSVLKSDVVGERRVLLPL